MRRRAPSIILATVTTASVVALLSAQAPTPQRSRHRVQSHLLATFSQFSRGAAGVATARISSLQISISARARPR